MTISASPRHELVTDAGTRVTSVQVPEDGGPVMLPAASFIAGGDFQRAGGDLVLSDATGNEVIVRGYFLGEQAPDLTSPDGSQVLTAGLLNSFLIPITPGQYAQTGSIAVAAPVGQVLDLDGSAFAIRADGTRVQLAKGDAVHEGDIIETGGAGSAIRMVFTDKTEFSLGADARLALDQLVFNPDTQSGSAQFSVLKGVFIFASGQIAKTDNTDMTVVTPVATIGIRGTEVAGRVSASDSQFTVIDGAIEVTTQAGSVTLDDRGETTLVAGNDSVPSDPIVLTAAQFGQAYGDVAGVVSDYFNQNLPGIQGPVPGGGTPEPSSPAADPGDRADSGTGFSAVASSQSPETENPTVLAATLADETTAPIASATLFAAPGPGSSGGAAVLGVQLGGAGSAVSIGVGAVNGGADESGVNSSSVIAVPGLDFGSGLTFSSPGTASIGGLDLFPAGDGEVSPMEVAQISFSPAPGAAGDSAIATPEPDQVASETPPLSQISAEFSASPFRGGSGSGNAFAGNPYITDPFGYSGPQLGDPVFNLVAGESNSAGSSANALAATLDTEVAAPSGQGGEGSQGSAPSPEPADITLVVSNATINQQYQDLTRSYELPNEGPGSFAFLGSEMGIPGVSASAEISLERDADGNVEVALTSAWDSVKNIRAESATAADIAIDNFVHADVQFGDGGDSHITVEGAKRGFITAGNGNDTVAIDAYSNGPGWSHTFDVQSGAGDDLLIFDGAANGLSHLTFDGGDGTDTLRISGAGETFSLMPGQIQVTGVERIDISGSGNTTLTVSSNLFDPSDPTLNGTQALVIGGDSGDILNLNGNDWNQVETVEIEGQGYAVYEHTSGMRVAADLDLQVT